LVHNFDQPLNQWFVPLATGDVGMKAWTQMQCSASVATGLIDFVIGHPIGIMTGYSVNAHISHDWLTNRSLAPRVYDTAYLAILTITDGAASPWYGILN
jgi:hypothetical protein